MFKTFGIITGVGLVLGFGLMLTDHIILGLLASFGSILIGMMFDSDMRDTPSSSYTSSKDKKPYYKDEFEKYQHYKHVKRNMKK